MLNDISYEMVARYQGAVDGRQRLAVQIQHLVRVHRRFHGVRDRSEGYRLGGFNAVAPCPRDVYRRADRLRLPHEQQFLPDKTLNKEIGIRSQFFNRSLTVNAAVYHIDWEDVQVAGITENGAVGITSNGAEAVSQGVEFSLQAALPGEFTVMLNYTFTDAKLTKDAKGSGRRSLHADS